MDGSDIAFGVAMVATLSATIRLAVPITLGAMSGIFSERSGIVNIGIEGMMLMAAFTGFMTNVSLSDTDMSDMNRLLLSVLVGVLTGGLMGLFHALLCVQYKVDHIISGTVINILALGVTGYFYDPLATTSGKIPPLVRNPWEQDDFFYDLGIILFEKDIITYLTFILVGVMTLALFKTVWGLRTRAIGENPRAADTLGINVYRLKYTNLLLSGFMAGLAGSYLTLADVGKFTVNITSGRGFIALAVMIFGKWHPVGAMLGALLFGFLIALQNQLQLFGIVVPRQFVSLLPYVVTVIVLAGFVGRARPPAHVGQHYETE
jgi:simple sugar transport system permease protein